MYREGKEQKLECFSWADYFFFATEHFELGEIGNLSMKLTVYMKETKLTIETLTRLELLTDGKIQGTRNITERTRNVFDVDSWLVWVEMKLSFLLHTVD